jgi:hypothetical protein
MEWIPLNIPRLQDGKRYRVRLLDGTVVEGVEYWGHGGGFEPLLPGEKSPFGAPNVKYPLDQVKEYLSES